MSVVTIDPQTIRGIIKWELLQASKGTFEAAHGKSRPARDQALNALADRIGKRLDAYTITRLDTGRGDASHLATRPDYSDLHEAKK